MKAKTKEQSTEIQKSDGTTVPMKQAIPAAALNAQLHNNWTGVSEADRLKFAVATCMALDIPTPLNPFRYIDLGQGRTVFYAPNEAAQLIAEAKKMSLRITNKYLERDTNIYFVEIEAGFPTGRVVQNIATLYVGGLTGDKRANAIMKAVTKGLRRTVFAAAGLSVTDDDELEILRKQESGAAYPAPPPLSVPSPNPPAAVPSPAPADDETITLRAEVFRQLTGKNGMFEGKPVKAKEWIESTVGYGFERLTADDCQELLAEIARQQIEESDESQARPEEGNYTVDPATGEKQKEMFK